MKKGYLVSIALLLMLVVLVVYGSRSGVLKNKGDGNTPQTASQSQPSHGQQGEDGGRSESTQQTDAAQEEQPEETPTVEIPEGMQRMIGVRTADVAVRPLQKVIRTVGRIEYDERKVATVNTKFEGWIEQLYVDYAGRYVKKDEPLAEIYSPELVATQQEFINVLKWARQQGDANGRIGGMLARDAGTLVDAARQRLKLWDISDEQITRIEASGRPFRTLTLYSPANGYVVQKMALKGMRVMPGEKLFDIADLSTVWVISDIYEYELPMIKTGQKALISLSYLPGKELPSTIEYVYPALAGDTRTAKVRFTMPNPDGRLKPQMFTNVEMKISLGSKLSIPDSAVMDTGTRQIVYVDTGEGNFEPREVRLGISAEGYREVLAGLKSGEKVASSATFLIDSEAQLKGVQPLQGHTH
jgi:Cu(I)/Ag(I) efflux system membrane fusion protein